jgi:hypothetical protein
MEIFGFSLSSHNRYGDRNGLFPNCGLNMVFVKNQEIPNLENVARDLLSFYTDLPAQQNLLDEFIKQFNLLMEKI